MRAAGISFSFLITEDGNALLTVLLGRSGIRLELLVAASCEDGSYCLWGVEGLGYWWPAWYVCMLPEVLG